MGKKNWLWSCAQRQWSQAATKHRISYKIKTVFAKTASSCKKKLIGLKWSCGRSLAGFVEYIVVLLNKILWLFFVLCVRACTFYSSAVIVFLAFVSFLWIKPNYCCCCGCCAYVQYCWATFGLTFIIYDNKTQNSKENPIILAKWIKSSPLEMSSNQMFVCEAHSVSQPVNHTAHSRILLVIYLSYHLNRVQ